MRRAPQEGQNPRRLHTTPDVDPEYNYEPAQVFERLAFFSMKIMGLKMRPIHHYLQGRMRAHTSFSACWPTTWSGICAMPGAS